MPWFWFYRPNWLKTTVWPGWIHTAESDWAMPCMRHQPHTMEPKIHDGTKSSNAQCRQVWTLSTWRSSTRWGDMRIIWSCGTCFELLLHHNMLRTVKWMYQLNMTVLGRNDYTLGPCTQTWYNYNTPLWPPRQTSTGTMQKALVRLEISKIGITACLCAFYLFLIILFALFILL